MEYTGCNIILGLYPLNLYIYIYWHKDFNNFIYFIFHCAGSLLLCRLVFPCGKWELLSSCGAQSTHWGGFPCCRAWALGPVGFSNWSVWTQQLWFLACGVQAQWLWHTGLVATWYVGSSWTWDWTHVSCIGSRFFNIEPSGEPQRFVYYAIFLMSSVSIVYPLSYLFLFFFLDQ